MTTGGGAFGGTLTRATGTWVADGFSVGQRITISGVTGAWQLIAITDAARRSCSGTATRSRRQGAPRRWSRGQAGAAHDVGRRRPRHRDRPRDDRQQRRQRRRHRHAAERHLGGGRLHVGQLVMIDGVPRHGLAPARHHERRPDAQARARLAAAELGPDDDSHGVRAGPARRADRRPRRRQHAALDELRHGRQRNNVTRARRPRLGRRRLRVTSANGQPQHVQVGGEASRARSPASADAPARTATRSRAAASAASSSSSGAALVTPSGTTSSTSPTPKRRRDRLDEHPVQRRDRATLPTSTLICAQRATFLADGLQGRHAGAGQRRWPGRSRSARSTAHDDDAPQRRADADADRSQRADGDCPSSLTVLSATTRCTTGGIRDRRRHDHRRRHRRPVAGPDSPLVVYGDTSQDGVWYAGHPYDMLGYEFGPKPFDPFTKMPDAENEDDEWVFPLANPYALRRQRRHRRAAAVRRSPARPRPAAADRRLHRLRRRRQRPDHRQPGRRPPRGRLRRRRRSSACAASTTSTATPA